MITNVNPALILPDEKSTSQDWITFYNIVVARYGKKAGAVAFVKAWQKFGAANSSANVNTIEKGTGLKFDKGLIASIEGAGSDAVDYIGGFFNSLGTGSKIAFYSAIGLSVLIVGGITIRVITLSSKDAGTLAGAGAKAFL